MKEEKDKKQVGRSDPQPPNLGGSKIGRSDPQPPNLGGLRLGDYNTLRIKKHTDYGLYLDGGDEGNILLPNRYCTPDMHIGQELEVFLYLDQDERIVAWSVPGPTSMAHSLTGD